MQARITELRSCSGERHGGQLAARAPHGRGVAGRPRRPSENMTGPQTTNMSATPGKSQNHTEACVMQTVTHLAGASRCCLIASAPLSPYRVYCSNFATAPRTPAASPTTTPVRTTRDALWGHSCHLVPSAALRARSSSRPPRALAGTCETQVLAGRATRRRTHDAQ